MKKIVKTYWRDALLVCTVLLITASLILITYGINQNNKLAMENKALAAQAKQHIDCIIKDLATPLPPGAKSRVITHPQSFCGIKFSN